MKQILSLLKQTGGKYVIVENGQPIFVVQSWEDFCKQFHQFNVQKISKSSEVELIDKINKEIASWKETQDRKRILDEFGTASDIPFEADFDYLCNQNLSTDVDIDQIPF